MVSVDHPPADKLAPSHYVEFQLANSHEIFGTSDTRTGLLVGYGYGRKDPRLRWKTFEAQLVHFLNLSLSSGEYNPGDAAAYGYTAVARYRFRTNGRAGAYLDLGWGVQFTDRTSEDIESHWNSTPYLGFGVAFKTHDGELLVGLAWIHISNANLVPPNHSQNYINISFGFRY